MMVSFRNFQRIHVDRFAVAAENAAGATL